jgi:hypothetical protein
MKRFAVLLATATGLSALVSCNQPLEPVHDPDAMKVTGLTAAYDKNANVVRLEWQPALSKANFYRVYRTESSVLDDNNQPVGPDTTTWQSYPRQYRVDTTHFTDIPGLGNTVYWYGIKAVRSTSGGETEGEMSNVVSVRVGVEVSFNIEYGQIFTVEDSVALVVSGPGALLESATFTQVTDGAGNPDFDAADKRNPKRSYDLQPSSRDDEGLYCFPWWLLKGNGAKTVWARLTYAGDTPDDVKEDEIQIAPFGNNNVIKIKIENRREPPDESMRFVASEGRDVIYRPWVKFTVTVFSDTTIARDFHYWLVLTRGYHQVSNSLGNGKSNAYSWLETPPIRASLTGIGPDHDEDMEYEYRLDDPDNLRYLLHTWDNKSETVGGAEELLTHNFNVHAVPGSYWGDPERWQAEGFQEVIGGSADPGTAARLRDSLLYLEPTSMQQGAKQVVVLALFRGRYFDDVRMAASVSTMQANVRLESEVSTYMDLYPPFANMKKPGEEYPHNFESGDLLTGRRITYELARGSEQGGGSVTDRGGADIDTIQLVIARMPEEMSALDDEALTDSVALLKPEDILNNTDFRHSVFPFEITVRSPNIRRVGWYDIPTSDWPTGKYIFAIRTVDEFGNGGFAPVSSVSSNPWWAKVLTGK